MYLRALWLSALILALIAAALWAVPATTVASPAGGDLDPAFGGGGRVTTDFPTSATGSARALVVLPDGKLVAAGQSRLGDPLYSDFTLERYNPDGSLDTGFGQAGKLATDFVGLADSVAALAIQTDTKVVAVGSADLPGGNTNSTFALARYNSDGSLDATFGAGGKVMTDINTGEDQASSVAIRSNGNILVAGWSSPTSATSRAFALAQYNPNGGLDTSFGHAGVVTTTFGAISDNLAFGLSIQADGKVVLAGNARVTDGTQFPSYFALARYNLDGSLDTTFGTGGKVLDFQDAGALALVLQPDGKLVAGGAIPAYSNNTDFVLARYNSDGSLDAGFGTGGHVRTTFGSFSTDLLRALTLQSDGKIVATGTTYTSSPNAFGLARYNPDGTLDTGFGTGGLVITNFGGTSDDAYAAHLTANDRIVAAGGSASRSSNEFALAQYNPDGSLDAGFGTGGKIRYSAVATSENRATGIAMQPDGKIVVAGWDMPTGCIGSGCQTFDFAVSRYLPDGHLDPAFGSDGRVSTDFDGRYDKAFAVALQGDGKIVVAGTTDNVTSGGDYAVARYNTDGSLDPTFGTGGKVTTDFSGSLDTAYAVAIQPNGKIVVAGLANGYPPDLSDFGLVRYNTDGTLDTAFGSAGKLTTDFAGRADQARALSIMADGRIMVAGQANVQSPARFRFALARYNADGTLDTSLGVTGTVTTNFGGINDSATSLVLQPDGKIVAAGYTGNYDVSDFALARYNMNGTLDSGFGISGTVTTDFNTGRDQINSLVLQSDGKLVAGGSAGANFYPVFALARYSQAGVLDLEFGAGGKITTRFSGYDELCGLALQPDNKLVAAGYTTIGVNADFALARYEFSGCAIHFADVSPRDYFYQAVRYLYCRGAISGYADGTFRPFNNTTRGQLSKIMVLGFGMTIYMPPTPTFRDVPTTDPFYNFVETAYSHGIISGYSCGSGCLEFRPGNFVTRGQLSKIAALAAGWPLAAPATATFQDVPIGSPFFRFVETAYGHAIISGYSCGIRCLEFRPGNSATRGQIAKIVYLAITQP